MIEIKTDIKINASQEQVWRVLTNFHTYPEWNSFFKSISGEAKEGETISVTISPPNTKPMDFKPTLLTTQSNEELRWRGTLLSSLIFQGEHYFQLKPTSDGKTQLIHGERFTGVLTPIFKLMSFEKNTQLGFEQFNAEIKARVESETQTNQ